MKKLIFISAFLLLIVAQTVSADVFFQPQSSTIDVGDPLTVDVMISGVVSPWLGGYSIYIDYDPTILQLVAVAWPDNFLAPSLRDATLGVGTVNSTELSLASVAELGTAQSGHDPFRLFEILFSQALAPGVSTLTFEVVKLSDGNGDLLAPGNTPGGSVTVRAVPEPSTMLLIGFGLLGLAVYGRKKFSKK